MADDVLRQGVQGITDLITVPGLVNLDFADVRTIMRDAGSALMGSAGVGENRAARPRAPPVVAAARVSIEGATGILLNITGAADLGLFEVNEAAEVVTSAADQNANVIFGAVIDDGRGDKVRVTVIATGFGQQRRRRARGGLLDPGPGPAPTWAGARPTPTRRATCSTCRASCATSKRGSPPVFPAGQVRLAVWPPRPGSATMRA